MAPRKNGPDRYDYNPDLPLDEQPDGEVKVERELVASLIEKEMDKTSVPDIDINDEE